jgi:hypothetical protein
VPTFAAGPAPVHEFSHVIPKLLLNTIGDSRKYLYAVQYVVLSGALD